MRTVLVVEDEFGAAEVLVAVLEEQGYRVLAAANGRDGLRTLSEHQVDLVVTDFMMPLMDGAALGRAMHEDPKLAAIPVLMMSGTPESALRQRFDGYAAFLRKPFRASEFLAAVRGVLAR